MCCSIPQVNAGFKDSEQMISPVENRVCLSGLKEREVNDFRFLGVDSPLCPGNIQDVVAQSSQWKPWPKIGAI